MDLHKQLETEINKIKSKLKTELNITVNVGIFVADNAKTYSFYIDKSNPLPQLKPIQS